ncbi:TPA: hypothetical protein EYP38_01300 [Candidatus Micrarchaeota archaeon]|nr:hypothetical protein [Candidatus Micrarchaeota archaeon]
MTDKAENKALDTILAYHQRTEHHFDRYAPGPGGLDWSTQPEPFRFYQGATVLPLCLGASARAEPPWYDELYGRVPSSPVNPETVSWLLFHSFALSAWKFLAQARATVRQKNRAHTSPALQQGDH